MAKIINDTTILGSCITGMLLFIIGVLISSPILIGFGIMFFVFGIVIAYLDMREYYRLYGSRSVV